MVTIRFNTDLISRYIGRSIDVEQLQTLIMNSKFSVEGVEGNTVEVEITPDRLDLCSNEGMALFIKRKILKSNEIFNVEKKDLFPTSNNETEYVVNVDTEKVMGRPYIAMSVVKGAHLTSDEIGYLMNYQELLATSLGNRRRIASVGLYPITIASFPLEYSSMSIEDIKFMPLNSDKVMTGKEILESYPTGVKYGNLVEGKPLVIKDATKNLLSMPPIVNSQSHGKIDENTDTILVEVTGTDKKRVYDALNLMLLPFYVHKFEVLPVAINYAGKIEKTPKLEKRKIKLTVAEINSIWGFKFSIDELYALLSESFDNVVVDGKYIVVSIPPFRIDILGAIDIIEEVGINYGYHKLSPTYPDNMYTEGHLDQFNDKCSEIEEYFVGFGFIQTHSMILSEGKKMDEMKMKYIALKNPMSNLYDGLRPNMLYSLLIFSSYAVNYPYPQKFFERGSVVRKNSTLKDWKVEKEVSLAFIYLDNNLSYTDSKAIIDYYIMRDSVNITFKPSDKPFLLHGRAADLFMDDTEVGFAGEIDPYILNKLGIGMPAVCGELYLDRIIK